MSGRLHPAFGCAAFVALALALCAFFFLLDAFLCAAASLWCGVAAASLWCGAYVDLDRRWGGRLMIWAAAVLAAGYVV